MLLFTVENSFLIKNKGLVLTPGIGTKPAKLGSKIKLIRPDQSIIETKIHGITFEGNHDILIGKDISEDDVPKGTEVWLID